MPFSLRKVPNAVSKAAKQTVLCLERFLTAPEIDVSWVVFCLCFSSPNNTKYMGGTKHTRNKGAEDAEANAYIQASAKRVVILPAQGTSKLGLRAPRNADRFFAS